MNLNAVPVFNTSIPPENHKTIPVPLDFTTASSIALDLFQMQQVFTQINFIQGIYFDAKDLSAALTATSGVVGQRIVCPALHQGYAPIMLSDPPSIIFTCAFPALVKIHLTNFHMPVGFWKAG